MKVTGYDTLKTFLRYVNLTAESTGENAKLFGDFIDRKLLKLNQIKGLVNDEIGEK
jgi:hypothetical protein